MCQHRKMRAVRAVKILKKAALKQEEIERFIHEIEILKTLVSYSNRIIGEGSSKYSAIVRILRGPEAVLHSDRTVHGGRIVR